MEWFGWYMLLGLLGMLSLGFYLLKTPVEGKLSEQQDLSVAVGGMVVLLFWPLVLVSVLIALGKKTPDE